MALMPEGKVPFVPAESISRRYGIAQDSKPSDDQLKVQRELREAMRGLAVYANQNIDDSREKSLGLTALEDSLMWLGKAVFQPVKQGAQ